MGSVANADVTLPDVVVPKRESSIDRYTSSSASTPEPGDAAGGSSEQATQEPTPVPKRKGGRKPIYATSEERKQRNRQAQAAFRERRTEYIKQLETTIQHHEETLQNLQQSHRAAADECLMLRYKNSLLERILLEKGIDVQAELALKGSPNLRPHRAPPITGQASPMQKAMLSRQQQAKNRPVMAPPIQTVNPSSQAGGQRNFAGSPTGQPTPPSQHSSPSTARSPGFALQGGMTSPATEMAAQQTQQHQQARPLPPSQQNPFPSQHRAQARSISTPGASQAFPPRTQPTSSVQDSYYPASFQKHYTQLGKLTQQEYDAQADMIDEMDGDDVDTDSFIPNFRLPPMTTASGIPIGMQASPPMTTGAASDGGGGGGVLIDPYDPMLDADPFGLTASMHFPNPYAYPPTQPRSAKIVRKSNDDFVSCSIGTAFAPNYLLYQTQPSSTRQGPASRDVVQVERLTSQYSSWSFNQGSLHGRRSRGNVMADVKSKNLYELLGNTSDQDSDREPDPPTKAVDKPAARHGKRDAPKTAPTEPESVATRGRGGRRGGGFTGNEAAFRDRATGRNFNRDQPTDGGGQDGYGNRPGRERGPGTRRVGRGPWGPRRAGDRHSRTGVTDHPKQVEHGWGENTGDGEWADEKAGEVIAKEEDKEEAKEGGWDASQNTTWNENPEPTTIPEDDEAVPEPEPEPEDTSKSYADYLAEQAAKKMEGLGLKEARAPNEGAKENKKWKSAKELTRDENEDYFKGEEKSKAHRERTTKKEFLDIDYSFKEQPRESRGRGGRGGGSGTRGRGDRGEFRGGRGRGRGESRGESRGRGRGRGGDGPGVAVNDENAFPSLGGK
ncbi:uncharacterized protein Z518_07984 [Rhinocladiella mackenziei CBS 650.93]|uniref:BZIP domain-containing protein n=1 Tax=Rhinocladiella mackenziei CBS 650.93 TaxID=1442369 RepID=A0A0D2IZK6_9EURO|nr:uncharacterized protein Z518_07984 [Rhinocladiella mackenziei CBS 650.93]KIX02045.1 hypothetical protein Z518_07984 [Rhinocladiella mackenziei CBS 650.93]